MHSIRWCLLVRAFPHKQFFVFPKFLWPALARQFAIPYHFVALLLWEPRLPCNLNTAKLCHMQVTPLCPHYVSAIIHFVRCFWSVAVLQLRCRWREYGRSVSETAKTSPGWWTLPTVMQEMCLAVVGRCRCFSLVLVIIYSCCIFIEHWILNHCADNNVSVTLLLAKRLRLYV